MSKTPTPICTSPRAAKRQEREVQRALKDMRKPLKAALRAYHGVFRSPIEGSHTEEVVHTALERAGWDNTWLKGSHAKGVDVRLASHSAGISVKSGTYDPVRGTLTFSASRLQKGGESIEGMLDVARGIDSGTLLFLARVQGDWKSLPAAEDEKTYWLFRLPSRKIILPDADQWKLTHGPRGGKGIWKATAGHGVLQSADIKLGLSSQLWMTLRTERMPAPHKLVISSYTPR